MITAREIVRTLDLHLAPEHDDTSFTRVIVDSRIAQPGDLFVALPGENTDGHRFIADAAQRGATGILAHECPDVILSGAKNLEGGRRGTPAVFLVEDPLAALQRLAQARRAAIAPRTIAVTGSVGKTSTKDAIAGLLVHFQPVLSSAGNLNTEIGLPMVLLDLTPEHRFLVVEMGMNAPGDIAALCRIAHPAVGIVTNVGPVHLERLGSMDRIEEAKAELPESLPEGGMAVLNADDPRVARMAGHTRASVLTYGLSPAAHCRATALQVCGLKGIRFQLHWSPPPAVHVAQALPPAEGVQPVAQGLVPRSRDTSPAPPGTVSIRARLLGRHSVYTCLAAAAVALSEGFTLGQVAEGLATLQAESRIKVHHARSGATVLDDCYNASPASVKAALDLLGGMPPPRVAVLGDMLELGAEEIPGHQEVGHYTAGKVDHLIAIGPRMAQTADAARSAGLASVQHFGQKQDAQSVIQSLASDPNTTVLIKASRGIALETVVQALCDD